MPAEQAAAVRYNLGLVAIDQWLRPHHTVTVMLGFGDLMHAFFRLPPQYNYDEQGASPRNT